MNLTDFWNGAFDLAEQTNAEKQKQESAGVVVAIGIVAVALATFIYGKKKVRS